MTAKKPTKAAAKKAAEEQQQQIVYFKVPEVFLQGAINALAELPYKQVGDLVNGLRTQSVKLED